MWLNLLICLDWTWIIYSFLIDESSFMRLLHNSVICWRSNFRSSSKHYLFVISVEIRKKIAVIYSWNFDKYILLWRNICFNTALPCLFSLTAFLAFKLESNVNPSCWRCIQYFKLHRQRRPASTFFLCPQYLNKAPLPSMFSSVIIRL